MYLYLFIYHKNQDEIVGTVENTLNRIQTRKIGKNQEVAIGAFTESVELKQQPSAETVRRCLYIFLANHVTGLP